MTASTSQQVTQLLTAVDAGDEDAATQLMPLVYDDLRALAADYLRRENPGHSLQPTALVNEAFLRLADQSRVKWKGKTHFFAVGAQVMRRILVDHARTKKRLKRGGGHRRIALHDDMKLSTRSEVDVLEVDEALDKLARVDERQAKIIELRFFGGLNNQEVADVLGVSLRTIEGEWSVCRAWLHRELSGGSP